MFRIHRITNQLIPKQVLKMNKISAPAASLSSTANPPVLMSLENDSMLAKVVLNRPKAFHALNLPMVRLMNPTYDEWMSKDSKVKCILMQGTGPKAFCAGGDVKDVRTEILSGGPLPYDFFYEEYQLDYKTSVTESEHDIVQISLWDGITMGGGVGLSVHGSIRVASESTLFAMPETAIGLFPDVGGTYALSRVTGGLPMGLYVALTGMRLKAADCLWLGLCTHYLPSSCNEELENKLKSAKKEDYTYEKLDELINSLSSEKPSTEKAQLGEASMTDSIIECFSHSTVEEIMVALESHENNKEWAQKTLKTLKGNSPLSMKVTLEAIKRHSPASFPLSEAFTNEYRLSQRFMRVQPESDFCEGIRAVLVDRDNKPNWGLKLDQVTDEMVQGFFAPLDPAHPRGELKL